MIDIEQLLHGFPKVGEIDAFSRGWNACYAAMRKRMEDHNATLQGNQKNKGAYSEQD